MQSKWMVSRNYINGEDFYQVVRLRDVNHLDESGNREVSEELFDNSSKEEAQKLADELNAREDKENV